MHGSSKPSIPDEKCQPSDYLKERFEAQKELVKTAPLISLKERKHQLDACIQLISDNRDLLIEAIEADFGARNKGLSKLYDLLGSISSLKHAKKNVKRWMRPQKRNTPFPYNLSGAYVHVEYQPKGVVGILGTWNVPLFTLFSPLAQVIAAGNRVLIKPSEVTPTTGEVLSQLLPNYISPDVIAVITGGRKEAELFSRLPFDHLVLTGGTDVGKTVMSAAAKNLTPVTLELGGKSPVIIGRSANIESAAEKIIFAKATNAGQICVCPDYVLVAEEHVDSFISACRAIYPQTYEQSPEDAGSIINAQHYERLLSYLDDAIARGYEVIPLAEEREYKAHCMPVVLVRSPGSDSLLRQHEIFGPILIIDSYQRIEDAAKRINAGDHPLALYYFGKDKREQRYVLDHTHSGGVTINHIAQHPNAEDAPFGGIGASGMGHYHGREGFLEFSHSRTIYTQGWFDINSKIGARPPFGKKLQKQLESAFK